MSKPMHVMGRPSGNGRLKITPEDMMKAIKTARSEIPDELAKISKVAERARLHMGASLVTYLAFIRTLPPEVLTQLKIEQVKRPQYGRQE